MRFTRAMVMAATVASLFASVVGPVSRAAAAPATNRAAAASGTGVTIAGHGYGHGRGMGQWGAQGYATQAGWSAGQILDHFYSNTGAVGISTDTLVDVRLMAMEGRDLRVTSGSPFVVGGIQVDPWRTVRLHWIGGNQVELSVAYSPCGNDEVPDYHPVVGNDWIYPLTFDPGDDINLMLTVCNQDGAGGNTSYRGMLRMVSDGTTHVVNESRIEQYLRGVVPRESPASWSQPALQAQAVAARSYGTSESRYSYAGTCDTTSCQVYMGAGRSSVRLEDDRTNAAIDATAGIVRSLSGSVARTEFSSSTGGFTAGGTFPAVPDAGDSISPHHDWSVSLSAAQIEAAYPSIGSFLSIQIQSRDGNGDWGGRVTSMVINGTAGSVTRTGFQFQVAFGLRSNWFTIAAAPAYLNWYLRNSASPGAPDLSAVYGSASDTPVVGDWDANGTDTIGVYISGGWYLRNSCSNGPPNQSFAYGYPGTRPVVGDWDGLGAGKGDGIGVYDNGAWYLRNSVSAGGPSASFAYGGPFDLPVVGDWDGNGTDTVGVYSSGAFYLRNSNSAGSPDQIVSYGWPGAIPIVGDWNGDGRTDIGVFDGGGGWYLRYNLANRPLAGPPDISLSYGAPGYAPLAGDWDGNGTDTIGVTVVA